VHREGALYQIRVRASKSHEPAGHDDKVVNALLVPVACHSHRKLLFCTTPARTLWHQFAAFKRMLK
jgi:hypothetical protein